MPQQEARAIGPMFKVYKSARRLASFRADYQTFEDPSQMMSSSFLIPSP